ncbi:MAG: thioredoxin [Ruminococcus sp.]|nr:thioredoxin [Ruminococcus sp.]MDD6708565.1 thioredoxin [Ruminococcus sp.]
MSIINLTKDSYHKEVMETEKVVVIDFWATWCGPCKMMAPVVEEVAKDYPDVKVCKVNVDEEPELSNAFKIVSIPTIVVIKNGEIIDSVVGYRPKEDIEKIIKLVK